MMEDKNMYYLLVCRSVTYAKQVQERLRSINISSRLVRTPVGAASESCGYSVRVSESDYKEAASFLLQYGPRPKKTIRVGGYDRYEEISG